MSAPRVTAGWPLDKLVSALARAGWAELDKRRAAGYRAVLRALVDLLPHGSATGQVTAPQLADAAGMSERWVRDRLGWLEHAEVIRWHRGGIVQGRPTPSTITVSKRAIADLVNRARRQIPDRLRERADTTARRIRETVRLATLLRQPNQPKPARRRVAPVHAELNASPLSLQEEEQAGRAPRRPRIPIDPTPTTYPAPPKVVMGSRRQALRARLAAING